MGWVNDALTQLNETGKAQIRPFGGSMRGRIESGQLVTLQAISPEEINVDDAALVRWKGSFLLHLIKDIQGDRVLIGNNLGKINGWIRMVDVLAKVIAVED